MLDSEKVRVALSGAVSVGPLGSPAPTSAASPIPPAYVDVGYISSDGIEESYDEDTQEIVAWQGAAVVRKSIKQSTAELKLTMIETSGVTLELYHKGSHVVSDGAGGWRLDVRGPNADPRSFIIDVIDGTKLIRIYVPNGEVTERGAAKYINDDAVGYEVTITCYPVDDVVMTKFSTDPAWGYSGPPPDALALAA